MRTLMVIVLLAGCAGNAPGIRGSDGGTDGSSSDGAVALAPPLCGELKADPALRACYDFDDGTGLIATDGSGNRLDLELTETVSSGWTSGRLGAAIKQYAHRSTGLEMAPGLTAEMTLEAWVNIVTDAPANDAHAIGRVGCGTSEECSTSYAVDLWPAGQACLWIGGGGARFPDRACSGDALPIVAGQWTHIAVSFTLSASDNASTENVTVYINGVPSRAHMSEFVAHDVAHAPPTVSSPIVIDASHADIDMVRIYSRQLSDREVCAHAGRSVCVR